ncbi:MAG: OmpA family protein [Flavobacteriales bacterium]|nr:OmpA family protein [Flavobacteriales bacterium]
MRINIAFTLLILLFIGNVQGQGKYIVKAEMAYASENFSEATKLCAQAYAKLGRKGATKGIAKKRKADMAYKTADSYRQMEHYKEANEWLDKSIILDYQEVNPEVFLQNGNMLQMMAEYEKAIKNYDLFLDLVPGDERGLFGKKSCEMYKEYAANKTRHKIVNQTAINKKQFDMAPMHGDRKKSKLYFSSARKGSTGNDKDPRSGEAYMDLWVSDYDKKHNWTEPYLVKGEGINTVDNEGTVCFDTRYKKMFFTRCPNVKKSNLGCDIWVSDAKGKTEWKEPTKLVLKTHDSISVGHPCTADGKFLIFASDMPGGMGGRDLWYSTYDKKADTWSKPINMGSGINTKGNELFPTFGLNGDLIYASDGLAGLGGLDIYRAANVGENKWENPTNLGSPINGINNDYALVEETTKYGYFTSERKSNNGEYVPDIYSYELPPNLFDLKVNINELGDKYKKIEDVKVVVTVSTGEKWEGYSDASGSVFWDKKPTGDRYVNEESSYNIQISKEGYHEDKNGSTFSTEGLNYGQSFIIDMALLPKKPIRLPEVRYPLSKWDLLVDSTINSPDSLLFVFNLLEEYPGMVLELSSHTDSRGGNSANQKLSENRAKACYKYLVEEKGVDPRRIVPVGKGEVEARKVWKKADEYFTSQPIDMTGVEEIILTEEYINKYRRSDNALFKRLHQFNRRAEGKVLSMEFDAATAEAADPKHMEYVKYP